MHPVDDDPTTFPPCAGAPPAARADLVQVRAWARSRGYPIDESAEVPPSVLRTYRLVHAG